MTDTYSEYANFVLSVVTSGDLQTFKSNPHYTYMLEHVPEDIGHDYLYNIISRFHCSRADIIEYCEMNDRNGSPNRYPYLGTLISPTSLRYFLQAMVILTYFRTKTTTPVRIVELGGGYGGLCVAINYCLKYFSDFKIAEYIIIDLAAPSKLQELYLSRFTLSYPCRFIDGKNFGAEVTTDSEIPAFLISNYCFSEIPVCLQEKYQEILFPKIKHGFITWNAPLRGFGKAMIVEEEYPKSGELNLYVKF